MAPRRHLATALAALALLAGCGGSRESGTAGDGAAPRLYRVRGVVRGVPDLRGVPDQILIHHEPIPEFVDVAGETVGMETMTMPFFPADGVEFTGLEPGDKVSFLLRVDWQALPPAAILEIEKLPPETDLDFEPPAP